MKSQTSNSPPTGEVHSIHEQALGNLSFIRQTMKGAGFFTALPGTAGIAMGAIGLLAALAAGLPRLAAYWIAIWLAAAGVAAAVGVLLIAYKAVATGVTIYSGPAKRFALVLLPGLLAGVILTVVLIAGGQTALLPGTWLLVYGCAVMAASVVSLPIIATLGACFMLLGTATFVVPAGLANLLLGAGFGGLHIIFGLLLARRSRG